MGNKNVREDAECQFFEGKMNNKKVFKKDIKKSNEIVYKIHRKPSGTAKSHKNLDDMSLKGKNSLKTTDRYPLM